MKVGQEFLQRDIYNFLVNNPTSINEANLDNAVSIYPNPAANILNITTSSLNFQVSVFDLTGQSVLRESNSSTIDISGLPTGLYMLKLQDQNSRATITRKFIHE
jgi:hypothetical protein